MKNLKNHRFASLRKLDAWERVCWLSLQERKNLLDPQAWMWLANLFKEKGQDHHAHWVLFNYRLRQAAAGNWFLLLPRLSLALLSWEPLLVLLPFLLILYGGSHTYQRAWNEQSIRPTAAAADLFVTKPADRALPYDAEYARAYPIFNPWIYTLENELPLVKFGMDDKWAPDPNLIAKGNARTYWYLAAFRWCLILAGWGQGIMLTIGINRRFHD